MVVNDILLLVGANIAAITFVGGLFLWLLRPHFNKAVIHALHAERGAWRELAHDVFVEDFNTLRVAGRQTDELKALIQAMRLDLQAIVVELHGIEQEVRRNNEAVAKLQGYQEAEP